jgi:hypothetical protein
MGRLPRAPRAAAPPRAAINSRRPMVTVIRPSRARCVKVTVPRHQRAVFTFKEHRCCRRSLETMARREKPIANQPIERA